MSNKVIFTPDTEESGGYVQITDQNTGEVYNCTSSTMVCDAIAAGAVAEEDIPKAGAYALGMWARYDWYLGSVGPNRATGQSAAASADTGSLIVVLEARARSIVALAPENAELKAAIDKVVAAGRGLFDAKQPSTVMTEGICAAAKSIM
ncbi:MAG: hypothetical protein Q4E12_00350 [Coriobacteriia bacterium]|nr:hypothetical protein [Coriobacteriia bacterium]